jgi:hypothetical protein
MTIKSPSYLLRRSSICVAATVQSNTDSMEVLSFLTADFEIAYLRHAGNRVYPLGYTDTIPPEYF